MHIELKKLLSIVLDTNSDNFALKKAIQQSSKLYELIANYFEANISRNYEDASQIHNQTAAQPVKSSNVEIKPTVIEQTWLAWLRLKQQVYELFESTNNEGIRTNCVKFIETVILMQTPKDKFTNIDYHYNLYELNLLPIVTSSLSKESGLLPENIVLFGMEHKMDLLEEGKQDLKRLTAFQATNHISSVNLMAVMQSLSVLARQRSILFMSDIIQALETLYSNLPPTLTTSQVTSVKKLLKLQLIMLLKHQYSIQQFRSRLTHLLFEVGSSQSEVNKIINDFRHKYGLSDLQTTVLTSKSGNSIPEKKVKLEYTNPQQPVKTKQLNISKITKEMTEDEKQLMVVSSVKRILSEEKCVSIPPPQLEIKKKVLSTLAIEFSDTICPKIIQDYVFQDLKNRHEIACAMIIRYFDIANQRAVKRQQSVFEDKSFLSKYSDCLHLYLTEIMKSTDIKDRDLALLKLYSESPYLTEEAIRLLETFITEHETYLLATQAGLRILVHLIESRQELSQKLLVLLVELAKYDQSNIKEDVKKFAQELYDSQKDNEMIKLFLEEELLSKTS